MTQAIQKPDFWQHQKEAVRVTQELSDLQQELSNFENVKTEEDLKKMEFRVFLSGKYDKGTALLSIMSGAGGQDAQDWATMMLRMYERYCQKKRWNTQILNHSFGDPGPEGRIGTKQVSFEVRGQYAFGQLKRESGVHRLVRISPFSSQALRHTSFAAVEVIPRIVQGAEQDIIVKPEEIRVDVFRSSGPGGQNVNKRETAIRITHLATGIIVGCQTQRTQQENRQKAMDMLVGKLYAIKEQERQGELTRLKGQKSSIEWGSQIRSYVYILTIW